MATVQRSRDVIYIFSANPPLPLTHEEHEALKSRQMSIKFELPTADDIYQYLVRVSKGDTVNARTLTDLIANKHPSYRDINTYLNRFISKESFLGLAIANIETWA